MHRNHRSTHFEFKLLVYTISCFLRCTFYSHFITALSYRNLHCGYIFIYEVALTSKQRRQFYSFFELSSCHPLICLPHGRGTIILFIVERQTEAVNINFTMFGLTRLEIEHKFTVISSLRSFLSTTDQNNVFKKGLRIGKFVVSITKF